MVLFILLTVFIAGLMVGRTPDYLGKRIEAGRHMVHGGAAGLRHADPVLLRRGGGEFVGDGRTEQCRGAWPFRNPLCLHVRRTEQRERLCGAFRQRARMERPAGPRHVHWAALG